MGKTLTNSLSEFDKLMNFNSSFYSKISLIDKHKEILVLPSISRIAQMCESLS